MQKALLILAALLVVNGLIGCAGPRAPVVPPIAFVYTSYKAPLMTHYAGSDLGTKKGTAKCQYILQPFFIPFDVSWGDGAIRQAAKDGGITTVKGADYEYMSVLGIYQEFTVYAYGD